MMKRNVLQVAIGIGGVLLMSLFSGCGGGKEVSLVNTVVFDAGEAQRIRLDYDADDIRLLAGEAGTITLKEYMNEDKKEYYANTSIANGELSVSEGTRPRRTEFASHVELLLPPDYEGGLSLHSTSGIVASDIPLRLAEGFSADTTSGAVRLSDIQAATIRLTTTSGTVEGDALAATALELTSTSGKVTLRTVEADTIQIDTTSADTFISDAAGAVAYRGKSGALSLEGLRGSGTFQASGDGNIEAAFREVTGDISVSTKNGAIEIGLPADAAFDFSATTKEGEITTPFGDALTVAEGTAAGVVGTSPAVTVSLETRNGDIRVSTAD